MKTILNKLNGFSPVTKIVALGIFLFAASSCEKKDDIFVPTEKLVANGHDISEIIDDFGFHFENGNAGIELKSLSIPSNQVKFKTLQAALVKTGLISVVARENLTLFAPTDDAFAALGLNPGNVGTVPGLKEILLYHVVGGDVYSYMLDDKFYPTLNGAAVEIMTSPAVMVNEAHVNIADVKARNGVMHVIDKVLFPPTMNLVQLALSLAPEFTTLVAAVQKAGLVSTLATGGPFTVFAPTNTAFNNLLAELGASSLNDIPAATLKSVLLYHVVSGRVYSSDLTSGSVSTLNGTFNVDVNSLTITDAKSRVANLVPSLLNVQATNGVVHVIDKVILP